MSLLIIVQDAMVLCGLARPSIAYASTDQTVIEFIAQSQIAGDYEARERTWRKRKKLGTFTGDGTTTEFDWPADFDRPMTGNPIWMTDWLKRPLQRVTDEQMMSAKIANVAFFAPIWRPFDDGVEFYPALGDDKVVNFEYRSRYWIATSGGTAQARWTADTNVSQIDEHVITLSTVWRWKASKGAPYAEDHRNWQFAASQASAADAAKTPIRVHRPMVHPGLATGVYGDVPPIVP